RTISGRHDHIDADFYRVPCGLAYFMDEKRYSPADKKGNRLALFGDVDRCGGSSLFSICRTHKNNRIKFGIDSWDGAFDDVDFSRRYVEGKIIVFKIVRLIYRTVWGLHHCVKWSRRPAFCQWG